MSTIQIAIVALVVLSAVSWLARQRLLAWWYLNRRRYPGCTNYICRRDMPHGPCTVCAEMTDGRTRLVTASGQRKAHFVCDRHYMEVHNDVHQVRLRSERTVRDWSEVTTPEASHLLRLDRMPDQFPGISREALRAFMASAATRAEVPDVDAGTLNASIANLGLTDAIYAETRDGMTVLRRTKAKAAR